MSDLLLFIYVIVGLFVAVTFMGATHCELEPGAYIMAAELWPLGVATALLLFVLSLAYRAAERMMEREGEP